MKMNMLDISTGNISEATVRWLEEGLKHDPELVYYQKGEYGFFVHVPEDDYWLEIKDELPEDLRNVLKYAFSNGCQWVMFDRDASLIRELPTFNW